MKNLSRGVAHVLLLTTIMLIASGIVGYIVYKRAVPNQTPTSPTIQPTPTTSPPVPVLESPTPTMTLLPTVTLSPTSPPFTPSPSATTPFPTPIPTKIVAAKKCIVSGCNGEICAEEPMDSICIYRPEYACYKNAICEIQDDENCGWTLTEELMLCLGKLI
jgi:hypothetical protein